MADRDMTGPNGMTAGGTDDRPGIHDDFGDEEKAYGCSANCRRCLVEYCRETRDSGAHSVNRGNRASFLQEFHRSRCSYFDSLTRGLVAK